MKSVMKPFDAAELQLAKDLFASYDLPTEEAIDQVIEWAAADPQEAAVYLYDRIQKQKHGQRKGA